MAELFIYDDIGLGGVAGVDVTKALAKLQGANSIDLRINSAGGDVFEGVAIYEALQRFSGRIVAHVDGLAASAASFIAMAADEIRIAPMGFVMVHEAHGGAIGRSTEMRQVADTLDKISGTIAKAYASRTGMNEADAQALMKAETWFDADEAIASGFADRLTEQPKRKVAAKFDASLHSFKNMPEPARRLINQAEATPAPTNDYLAMARMRARVRAKAAAL